MLQTAEKPKWSLQDTSKPKYKAKST